MGTYSGLVRSDGWGPFITTIDVAANPAWSAEQPRLFAIMGDRLSGVAPDLIPVATGPSWGLIVD